jgi:hypothetical protein
MASPVPLLGGNFLKGTLFFNFGRWGWSESFYAQVVGGTDPIGDMARAMQDINLIRRNALSETCTLEGMRVEFVSGTNIGQSEPYFQPAFNLGSGIANAACSNPWNMWILREFDQSGVIHGTRPIRGSPDADYTGYTAGSALLKAGPPPRITALVKALSSKLGIGITGPSGGAVIFCLPGYNRNTAAAPPGSPFSPIQTITTTTLSVTNRLIFTVIPGDVNISTNSTILVRAKRQRCVRGVSGPARVESAPILNGVQTITTTKLFCCPGVELGLITGTLRNRLQAYYQYRYNPNNPQNPDALKAIRAANKKTGKTFFGTVGRQSSRCC